MLNYKMIVSDIEDILHSENKNRDKEKEMTIIKDFVHEYRREYNISPTPGVKFELSCFAFGEGYNLIYRQLINTNDNHDGWKELDNDNVRSLVLEQIKKDLCFKKGY